MMVPRPAVFLDRDGVINQESGYVHKLDEFHFIDGVFDACLQMASAGYRLIVITNEAGIRAVITQKMIFITSQNGC